MTKTWKLDKADNTEQHFWTDTDGAHISSTGDHDTSGFHQLLTSVKNAFMHGTTELMTISADLIELGKNSANAVISFCGGTAHIGVKTDELGSSYLGLYGSSVNQYGSSSSGCVTSNWDKVNHKAWKSFVNVQAISDTQTRVRLYAMAASNVADDGTFSNPDEVTVDITPFGIEINDNGTTYPFSMLQNALENTSTSTTETPVGTWIDGKTIYRKCINIGTVTTPKTDVIPHNIANPGRFTRVYGIARDSDNVQFQLPYANGPADAFIYAGAVGVVVGQHGVFLYDCVAILEYTKS